MCILADVKVKMLMRMDQAQARKDIAAESTGGFEKSPLGWATTVIHAYEGRQRIKVSLLVGVETLGESATG